MKPQRYRDRTHSEWTKDRDLMMLTLIADGLTYPEVADRLGCTHNAISGRVSRLRKHPSGGVGYTPTRKALKAVNAVHRRAQIGPNEKPLRAEHNQHVSRVLAERPAGFPVLYIATEARAA